MNKQEEQKKCKECNTTIPDLVASYEDNYCSKECYEAQNNGHECTSNCRREGCPLCIHGVHEEIECEVCDKEQTPGWEKEFDKKFDEKYGKRGDTALYSQLGTKAEYNNVKASNKLLKP